MIGTRLRKVDLHIHSPGSADYKDTGTTASDIVAAATKNGLEAIAITDHNAFAWVEQIRKAASKRGLIVFPGFEVNADGGHIIGIFDPEVDLAVLETALIECGVPKKHWGEEAFLAKDITEVTSAICRRGGICVAAHIDGPKGILCAVQQGAARMRAFNDPNLSAVEFLSSDKLAQYSSGKVRGYQRTIAHIQGSDSHRLSEVGRRLVLLRMDHLSLEGVRQAFSDPQTRVRIHNAGEIHPYASIESLTVDAGFLKGQEVQFNPSLNCLVGGAGSGKSTIIEFLRFALDQSSTVESIADDLQGKLRDLAGLGATIAIRVRTASGDTYDVRRVYDSDTNPISITRTADGTELTFGEVRALFPVFAYSQGEVTAICRSPLAQLELVDCHLDLKVYASEIKRTRSWLERQAKLMAKTEAAAQDRAVVQGDLATAKSRISLLSEELRLLKGAKKDRVVLAHQLWLSEETFWTELLESLSATRVGIDEGMEAIELPACVLSLPDEKTPNRALLQRAGKGVAKLEQGRAKLKAVWLKQLGQIEESVTAGYERWKDEFSVHKSEYSKAASGRKPDRMMKLSAELAGLRKSANTLSRKVSEIAVAERNLRNQRREWDRRLDLVEDQRRRIRTLREMKARQMVKEVGGRVSLTLVADGNRLTYQSMVAEILRGSHAPKSVAAKVADSMLPRDLAGLVRDGATEALSRQTGVDQGWAAELVDRLKKDVESLYRIETAALEDGLDIGMKVGATEYRSLDRLSTGQKATVVVLLTMAEGEAPILFDQPEDALYTPFIYSDVVKTLRQGKDSRQFILATHNPNIAVGADVDLGIVLDSDASQTSVAAAGGLDDEQTRGLLLLHLEGGEKALRARQIKFGLEGGKRHQDG